jgi:single-stranded DNA-binding protein
MAMARLAVALPCNAAEAESQPSGWALLLLGSRPMRWQSTRKATLVSVAGNMQVNQWTGQDGTQQGYQVVADSVISARTVRPGGKAGQQGQATDALRRAQQPSRDEYDQRPPFDDETPF